MERKTIEISTGIIFRTVLVILSVWFLFSIRDIVALVFIAIVIVSAIDPFVTKLQKRGIPRAFGVLIIYALISSALALAFSFLLPPVAHQFQDFFNKLPSIISSAEKYMGNIRDSFYDQNISFDPQKAVESLNSQLSFGTIFSETVGVFSGIVSALIVLVMTFYMAMKENGIKNFVVSITPEKHKAYAASLSERIQVKIGKWMQGQLFLMFVIFVLNFIGLYLIGIPYALTLAILAGILEIIPYIGPMLSAVPGIIVGFTISPLTGFIVLLLYIFVQQFENHVVVPQVMKKAVGLNPITVIIALLIGAKLGGVLGAILAIPIATAISVFVADLMSEARMTSN